jgi:glycerate 2-kinase
VAIEPAVFLRKLFDAALEAALPEHVIAKHLPAPPTGRVLVLGAGKASAAMAAAVERAWPDVEMEGLVVTRYGHAVPTTRIKIVEAAHPVPDERGQAGAARILELARGAGPDDLVLCLISGGASALLSAPAEGVTFAEKQFVNDALLRSGAPIDEMNAVRKRLSAIKGGRLANAIAPARALTLLISDVPGDSPAVIGSGPTVPDSATADVALGILRRYEIELPEHLLRVIESNEPGREMPPGHEVVMVATPQMSLEAAAAMAREHGVTPIILGDAIEGEAREVGRALAGVAHQIQRHGQPVAMPAVILSGGETTVTVRGKGRGGRNSEFSLGLALALAGNPGVCAIACDTDGIDGSEDNAGALVLPDVLDRCAAAGLDPHACLNSNDAYSVFEAADALVVSGPTLTNVNDFRAILVTH